jgi:hypothetical protein
MRNSAVLFVPKLLALFGRGIIQGFPFTTWSHTVDKKTSKRIDSLYRNIKQLPLLAVLGIFIPILLPFVPLLCLAYLYLRSRLLAEIDSGKLPIDLVADSKTAKVGELSVVDKLKVIRSGGGRLWAILAIFLAIPLTIIVVLISIFAGN